MRKMAGLIVFLMFILSSISFAETTDTANNIPTKNAFVSSTDAKPIMGAVIIFDATLPSKNDMYSSMSFLVDKKYPFEQLNEDYNINKTIRQAIADKYSSRFLTLESNSAVTKTFTDYVDSMKTTATNTDVIPGFADSYKYDYLIVAKTKITRIERKTTYAIFSLLKRWVIDTEVEIKLYSKKDGKYLYDGTIKQSAVSNFQQGPLILADHQVPFKKGMEDLFTKVVNQFDKEVPYIMPSPSL